MMNSDQKKNADSLLDDLFESLDDTNLQKLIDNPIRNAADDFEVHNSSEPSFDQFVKTTAQFVQYIYANGFQLPIKMTVAQAKAELLVLLEEGYQNANTKGFDAAYLDFLLMESDGLAYIMRRITDIIISRKRASYAAWIISSRITPQDWQIKCLIVESIFSRWAPYFPKTLLNCQPAQLANHIPGLIQALIQAANAIDELRFADMEAWPGPEYSF